MQYLDKRDTNGSAVICVQGYRMDFFHIKCEREHLFKIDLETVEKCVCFRVRVRAYRYKSINS